MNVEEELSMVIPKIAKGDVEAFEEFYNLTQKYVYKVAYAITLSKEDAEDVVQNTYLTIFKKRKKLYNNGSIMGYVKKIAINNALKIVNNRKIKFVRTSTPDDDEEIKDIVIKALEKLDSKDRTVLSLFYLDNMKTKDISFLLNESEESVRTRLSRARTKLKEVIEDGKV